MHLHALITDGTFEEGSGEVRFLPAQVHAAVADDDDLDLDPALAACVQLGLAGPHLAALQEAGLAALARRGPA